MYIYLSSGVKMQNLCKHETSSKLIQKSNDEKINIKMKMVKT